MWKKWLGWLVVALLIYFIVKNPTGASGTVRSIWSGLTSVGNGLGNFIASLSGNG